MKCYHCYPNALKIDKNYGVRMTHLQHYDLNMGDPKHFALVHQPYTKGQIGTNELI